MHHMRNNIFHRNSDLFTFIKQFVIKYGLSETQKNKYITKQCGILDEILKQKKRTLEKTKEI